MIECNSRVRKCDRVSRQCQATGENTPKFAASPKATARSVISLNSEGLETTGLWPDGEDMRPEQRRKI
jgi:hypothetical protein